MFKQIIRVTISVFIISILFSGCATVFKGYEDKVAILNPPDNLKITTIDGSEIQLETEEIRTADLNSHPVKIDTLTNYFINLRSNKNHVLVLESGNRKKIIEVYPKLGAWWFIADILTATFFIDMYTGNWNYFENINVEF
jgi:hypothetical protein